jgi:hypothetical protein
MRRSVRFCLRRKIRKLQLGWRARFLGHPGRRHRQDQGQHPSHQNPRDVKMTLRSAHPVRCASDEASMPQAYEARLAHAIGPVLKYLSDCAYASVNQCQFCAAGGVAEACQEVAGWWQLKATGSSRRVRVTQLNLANLFQRLRVERHLRRGEVFLELRHRSGADDRRAQEPAARHIAQCQLH